MGEMTKRRETSDRDAGLATGLGAEGSGREDRHSAAPGSFFALTVPIFSSLCVLPGPFVVHSLVCVLAYVSIACTARTFAQADARPNILFAISDDQSWMHASAYGDPATKTPAFDRVAREGVLFRHAYAAAPSCAPSRSAILTGRNIWELEEGGILFGILKAKFTLFSIELAKSGYQLAATGKTWGPGRLSGFDRKGKPPSPDFSYVASTTERILGKAYNSRRLAEPRRGLNRNDYAANFADFLRARDPSKPFFFWFGATEPHQNYDVDAWKRAGKKLENARLPACLPDHPSTRGEILDYGLEIEHFDAHLGRMLAELENAGELDRTLVVVTSDHGNPLPRSKCNLYDSGTRVPLAARWPAKIPGGRTVDDFVNLIDLAPTFLEAAGVAVPEAMRGRALWPVLSSTKAGRIDPARDFVVTAFERHIITRRNGVGYPMRAIRTHRYAYIRNYEPERWPAGDPDFFSSHQQFFGDCDRGASKTYILQNAHAKSVQPYYLLAFGRRSAEELYDMENDPGQLHNLAASPAFAETKAKLSARLETHLRESGDPRQRGEAPWDDYPFTDGRIFRRPDWKTRGGAAAIPGN